MSAPAADAPLKILVIRRDNIGDLVCSTPLVAALRARFPRATIAALVNSYNAGVLAGNPDLNAVHVYTKLKHREPRQSALAAILDRLRLTAALRRERFDYAILAKAGFDRHGLKFARAIGPRTIIGFAPADAKPPAALTMPIVFPATQEMHEVEVVMRLVAPLGVTSAPGPLRMFPSAARASLWRRRLQNQARPPRPWVALHISARQESRRWPAENFAALINRLATERDARVVLLWAPGAAANPRHPGDDEKANAVLRAVNPGIQLLSAASEELEDLTAVLSLCDAFIGVDGGALHIAAALALPIVALFENIPFKQRHWYPWHVPYEMVASPTPSIADISVPAVIEAWDRLVARRVVRRVS